MKQLIGLFLIILAIPVALYVGLWLCFIGGIVQVINAIKMTPVEALPIAIGIGRIFGAGIIGFFTFGVMLLPGIGLLNSYPYRRRRIK